MDILLLQNVDTLETGEVVERFSILGLIDPWSWIFLAPILLLFVIAIYIFIERTMTIGKAGKVPDGFTQNIRDYVMNGNIPAAMDMCKRTDLPVARMIEKGIQRIGKPLKNIEASIENVGKLEVFKLERGLPMMATISGAAPMLGFLGTVTGMIKAFYNLAQSGSEVAADKLAGGIYEALFTTAAGLIVGIIAFVGYNVLTTMVDKAVNKMEATSVAFIDLLQEPAS